MKQEIFDKYISHVCDHWKISQDELFTKHSGTSNAQARQMLWWLCFLRGMKPFHIKKAQDRYMPIRHSTILHGIKKFSKEAEVDRDLHRIAERIHNQVII